MYVYDAMAQNAFCRYRQHENIWFHYAVKSTWKFSRHNVQSITTKKLLVLWKSEIEGNVWITKWTLLTSFNKKLNNWCTTHCLTLKVLPNINLYLIRYMLNGNCRRIMHFQSLQLLFKSGWHVIKTYM
jgi:hypothetical protein